MKTTLSGPGIDKTYGSQYNRGAVLSAAITQAAAHTEAATFYVRDEAGDTVGRVERDDHGALRVYGEHAIKAERASASAFTPGGPK